LPRGRGKPLYETVIEKVCEDLGLPKRVASRAIEIARELFRRGGGGKNAVASVASGAIYIACIESRLDPRVSEVRKAIRELLGVETSPASSAWRISRRLGIEPEQGRQVSRAAMHLMKLESIDSETRAEALSILEKLSKKMLGAKPQTVAAVAIAIAEARKGRDPDETLAKVCKELGISRKNVARWLRELGVYRLLYGD